MGRPTVSTLSPAAKPKFNLPANRVASLQTGSNPIVTPPTSPTEAISPIETVAPKIPADAGSPGVISNANFIEAIFGSLPEGASALVCSKSGDPEIGSWMPKGAAQVQSLCPSSHNNYFNCSCVTPNVDGSYSARKDNAAAYHCLVLDDVGTKVKRARLGSFMASWALETSPGNFQVGYILAEPITDAAEVTKLQDMVIAADLCDPGANGMTRWMRLPVGINGKVKHRSDAGQPFQCVLEEWQPEMRYTVDQIVVGLKLASAPIPKPVDHGKKDALKLQGPDREINPADVARIPALLAVIDPDCGRPDWLRVLMAVFHTTGGSDDGFALIDAWSRKGKKYPGTKDLAIQWRSFRGDVQMPVTMGTLIKMARDTGADIATNVSGNEPFAPCEMVETTPKVATGSVNHVQIANPLTRYSLKDSLEELEKQRVEQILIFGQLVLLGQATVIYALANTGKTLILLHLIIEAIKKNMIDPSRLYYINMDDNSSGLVDKVRLVAEYGFHMIADGHRGFEASEFREAMVKMIETNTASGAVVVLDTLKKFVNTMSKDHSRAFTKIVRQFSLKGGTVIALSHANKNRGVDGKIKYTGTTDIVDDFDCAYTLETISEQGDTNLRVVEFTNIKRRGDVALTTAYSYALERGLSYDELLTSVQEVDPNELKPIKQAAQLASDAAVIAAVQATISQGIVTKMKIVDAAAECAGVPIRQVLNVIEKYTGNDPSVHRWKFVVRERGAKVFYLLEGVTLPTTVMLESPAPLPVEPANMQPMPGSRLDNESSAVCGTTSFQII